MRNLSALSLVKKSLPARFFALAAALTALPSVAQAQDTATVESRVGIIEPLTITKLSDLDFGDIVPSTGGTVVLNPTISPTCTVTGAVIQSGECQPASFGGFGGAGQRVRVRRPVGRTITMTGPGADMTVTDIIINGSPDMTPVRSNPNWERFLIGSADGTFVFRVGGTLNVNPNQTPGLYTGTFDIRLDYQ
ncbi:MAG: DUF4402 domain-containing protein [Pseudomonadota bacterium]